MKKKFQFEDESVKNTFQNEMVCTWSSICKNFLGNRSFNQLRYSQEKMLNTISEYLGLPCKVSKEDENHWFELTRQDGVSFKMIFMEYGWGDEPTYAKILQQYDEETTKEIKFLFISPELPNQIIEEMKTKNNLGFIIWRTRKSWNKSYEINFRDGTKVTFSYDPYKFSVHDYETTEVEFETFYKFFLSFKSPCSSAYKIFQSAKKFFPQKFVNDMTITVWKDSLAISQYTTKYGGCFSFSDIVKGEFILTVSNNIVFNGPQTYRWSIIKPDKFTIFANDVTFPFVFNDVKVSLKAHDLNAFAELSKEKMEELRTTLNEFYLHLGGAELSGKHYDAVFGD